MRPLISSGRIIAGGHSYGGRQTTLLAAEDHACCDALLLLSYPLHPPKKPSDMRTAHFAALQTPALFVHGTVDPFGSPNEMQASVRLISSRTRLVFIDGAGHDLNRGKFDIPALVIDPLAKLL
jgi:predicted alpha/beta-hydrolase family hydrolase